MARLAPIATIFLPLSFLIGFLGQNFSTLIDIQTGWVSFILLGPVLEALAIVAIWALPAAAAPTSCRWGCARGVRRDNEARVQLRIAIHSARDTAIAQNFGAC